MTSHSHRQQQGFTIIEIMIVLAIAALIMTIVFLAVPALNRNKRNMVRKNDLGKFTAGIEEYRLNTQKAGIAPFQGPDEAAAQSEFDDFQSKYLGPEYQNYTFEKTVGTSNSNQIVPNEDEIIYVPNHRCNHGTPPLSNTVVNDVIHRSVAYAVLIGLEPNSYYCLDNT